MIKALIRWIFTAGSLICAAALLTDCAQQANPQGGPVDETPPEVVRTNPETGTLNYSDPTVRIFFDEAVKKGTYGKEIFISPLPQKRPRLILNDNAKRLSIRFEEEFRPQTTYVITLNEISGHYAPNKMKEAYTLAFSSGDKLDSLQIKGKVLGTGGEAVKEMTMLLFDADSVPFNDFFGVRPAYITKSTESGAFSFSYLRDARFRLFGVKDEDQSNSWSTPNELIAVSMDSLVNFNTEDSTGLATAVLYAFKPDDGPPRLQNYAWLNQQTLLVRFSENLNLDSLQIVQTDTLGQDSSQLTQFTWFPKPDPELMLHVPKGKADWQIHFRSIADSLGNRIDTVLRVEPKKVRTETDPFLQKPQYDLENLAWEIVGHHVWTEADLEHVFLTDTSSVDSLQKQFVLRAEADAFRVKLRPEGDIDPKQPYDLKVNGAYFLAADSMDTDSTWLYPVTWPDITEYGTLQGVLHPDTSWRGPWIAYLVDEQGKEIRTFTDTAFSFRFIPPGKYGFKVLLDADGNGTWTTGSVFPPRRPETIWTDSEKIEIRANWDFEDHVVEMNKAQPTAEAEPEAPAETDAGAAGFQDKNR
ncbi:MAG: Ig-like domain-containing protein [Bacteroidota bacterium]